MTSHTENTPEQSAEKPELKGLEAADLAAFLKDNPTIFQQRPELLELVTLSDNRSATSLLERQVNVLRTRLEQQKSTHSQLFQVARENEQISDNFSEIVYQMIGFTNLSEFATHFPSALKSIFDIDEVSFKTAQSVERKQQDKQSYDDALRRLTNNSASCDNRWPSSIMGLFFNPDIQSAALIPMCNRENEAPLGILALGSRDADRYTNDLGSVYLDKLGLMSGICLSRLQLKTLNQKVDSNEN